MIPGNWQLSAAPEDEPVTLAEAKLFLRVDGSDNDTLITELLAAARERVEQFTRRQLMTATWVLKLDAFPSCRPILLPRPPLQSVESIDYIDADGDEQELDADLYVVDTVATPGRITPAYGQAWPTTRVQPNAVTVTFDAGWEAAADVPARAKAAIKLLLADMYEHREARLEIRVEDNPTAKALLNSLRVMEAY